MRFYAWICTMFFYAILNINNKEKSEKKFLNIKKSTKVKLLLFQYQQL